MLSLPRSSWNDLESWQYCIWKETNILDQCRQPIICWTIILPACNKYHSVISLKLSQHISVWPALNYHRKPCHFLPVVNFDDMVCIYVSYKICTIIVVQTTWAMEWKLSGSFVWGCQGNHGNLVPTQQWILLDTDTITVSTHWTNGTTGRGKLDP